MLNLIRILVCLLAWVCLSGCTTLQRSVNDCWVDGYINCEELARCAGKRALKHGESSFRLRYFKYKGVGHAVLYKDGIYYPSFDSSHWDMVADIVVYRPADLYKYDALTQSWKE